MEGTRTRILYPLDKLDAPKSRGFGIHSLGTQKPDEYPVILGADWKPRIYREIEKFAPGSPGAGLLPRTRRTDSKKGKLSAST